VEDNEPTRYAWSRDLTECGAIVRALTAYDVPEHREHAFRQGFSAFLAKPVDPSLLAQEIVRHVLRA
jgi:CheY-like chemotaxis protein